MVTIGDESVLCMPTKDVFFDILWLLITSVNIFVSR